MSDTLHGPWYQREGDAIRQTLDAFVTAVLRPTTTSFESMAHSSGVSSALASAWLVAAYMLFPLASRAVALLTRRPSDIQDIVIGAPLGFVFLFFEALILWLLFCGLIGSTHAVARMLGGKGGFVQLMYVSAAFWAPLLLLGEVVQALPFNVRLVSTIALAPSLYGCLLQLVATKAVHGIAWVRAVAALLPAGLSVGGLLLLGYLFSLL